MEIDQSKITRLEVIDMRQCYSCRGRLVENVLQPDGNYKEQPCNVCDGRGCKGRDVIFHNDFAEVSLSVQDDGRTLKVFVEDRREES